ncbi:MAG: DUF5329 family protein [Aquabacterium sp.]
MPASYRPNANPVSGLARQRGVSRRRALLALAAPGLLAGVPAALAAPSAAEQARIDKLIEAVGTKQDMVFIRNRSEYNPKQAAEFLRRKLRSMGGDVQTCEDFIVMIASKSTTSGELYRVRYADGRVVPSEQFMRDEMARIERKGGY